MSKLRANQIVNKAATGAPTAPNGLVVTGVSTATTFSGSGANLTSLPSAQLTGALPAISGANLTGISSPLVAYKAKEFLRQKYSFSGSSFHEIETNFRISHTPAAVGNTIICHCQIYLVISENTYGGLTLVTDQGSNSDEAMIGESSTSGAVQKGTILGGTYLNESQRQSGGTTWLGQHMWGYHVTENTNQHLFKLFGRMGSGTRNVGDNQMGQFMQMWEYEGNVMQ